jgi:hypothetical protein
MDLISLQSNFSRQIFPLYFGKGKFGGKINYSSKEWILLCKGVFSMKNSRHNLSIRIAICSKIRAMISQIFQKILFHFPLKTYLPIMKIDWHSNFRTSEYHSILILINRLSSDCNGSRPSQEAHQRKHWDDYCSESGNSHIHHKQANVPNLQTCFQWL